jgi:hypothetical protein
VLGGIAIRASFLGHQTTDYGTYFKPWYDSSSSTADFLR